MIIDCDTIFYKRTKFIENDIPYYNYGDEYYKPYFDHMSKLHPTLEKQDQDKSGISHHMLMQKHVLIELFKLVETHHQKPLYQVFLENINTDIATGASEYEIYFNYLLKYVPNDLFKLRKLNYIDTSRNNLEKYMLAHDHDYISYHWYR